MNDISKAVRYRSYFEVAQKIKNPEARLAFYEAVDFYTFEGKEPKNLPIEADIAFTAIRANIDADLKRKSGGAPVGNTNAKKTTQNNLKQPIETTQNNLKQPVDLEKTNNVNVNENDNEDVNAQTDSAYVCETNFSNFGKTQKDCWELIQEHNKTAPKERKIPCSTSFMSFIQKEMREILDATGRSESPETITQALQNFIKVAKSDTWQKTFSWRSFCKNFQNYKPEYFTLEKYLNSEPETEDGTQKPEYKFYMRMKDNPRFSIDLFQAHIEEWKAEGRPEGADYFKLQNAWEANECL